MNNECECPCHVGKEAKPPCSYCLKCVKVPASYEWRPRCLIRLPFSDLACSLHSGHDGDHDAPLEYEISNKDTP